MDELQAKIVAGRKAVMAADESISREEAKLFGHGIHRGCQFFQKRLTTLPPDRRLHLSTPAPISQRVFAVVNVTVSRHDRHSLKALCTGRHGRAVTHLRAKSPSPPDI